MPVSAHKSGQNCPKCRIKTFEENVKDFRKIHGNRYQYPESTIKSQDKFNVLCEKHGLFSTTPNSHKRGSGCPKCSEENSYFYSLESWENAAKFSTYFDSFKVYIIECWDENEHFIKIGRTFKKTNHRFKGSGEIPYNFKVLFEFPSSVAKESYELEKSLHIKCRDFSYRPLFLFEGWTECFLIQALEFIQL